MDFAHLLELSEEKFKTCYEVNEAQHIAVEENTRKQFSSKMWFRMQAGRVTASRLKAVCHTSLINSISYPEQSKKKNGATKAGVVTMRKWRQTCTLAIRYKNIKTSKLMNLDFLSTKPMASLVHSQMGYLYVAVVVKVFVR